VAPYPRNGTKHIFTFKFLHNLDLQLIHIALYALRKKKQDKSRFTFQLRQLYNFLYYITFYIDFIFSSYSYYYIEYYFSFLQILGFMFFITLLRNCYFSIGNWNNLCEAWRLFGLKQILMMSWEARSRITNLSQLSSNNNTSSTPKMSVKESFWALTTNIWGFLLFIDLSSELRLCFFGFTKIL
jgi:hypothetical protein